MLDRLSSGQVFRPSVSTTNANGTDGKEGSGAGGGSGYDNGGLRLPGDPPAQPNFVGGARCALCGRQQLLRCCWLVVYGDNLHKGHKLNEGLACRGRFPLFNAQLRGSTSFLCSISLVPYFLCCFSREQRSGGRKGGRAERRREAVVGGASFKAVGSALLVAEMSANFLQFADHFPTIGTDILTRLGELLRVRFFFFSVYLVSFCASLCCCRFSSLSLLFAVNPVGFTFALMMVAFSFEGLPSLCFVDFACVCLLTTSTCRFCLVLKDIPLVHCCCCCCLFTGPVDCRSLLLPHKSLKLM